VAFDDDIDIRDTKKVLWALSSRVEPERDIQIIKGAPLDSLDHSSGTVNFGSKVLIDATRKGKEEGYYRDWPDVISMSDEIKKRVDKKWNSAMR
jgi:3-octaprenyl-4hydroxybenzoate decarboxylase (EC 4.1.1.-)